jgi:MerR family transcriptional regulator/heat shock protein HspR
MDDRPRYMISVAAELVGMHPQTLRIYEAKGLVNPQRTAGNTRLYSEADLERLRLINRLTTELGLNLAGVEHVIRLEEQLRRMQRTMERLERELREQIAEVHRQYRRDLVPYDPQNTGLARRWTSTS